MAELEEGLKQKIRDLIDKAYDVYSAESIEESVKLLNEAWSMIPGEKTSWEEGYRVAHEFVETYFSFGDYKEAEKWATDYLKADERFRNLGGAEFDAGRVAYELDKMEEAKRYFMIADEKSGGRLWKERKDTKYYKFYSEK